MSKPMQSKALPRRGPVAATAGVALLAAVALHGVAAWAQDNSPSKASSASSSSSTKPAAKPKSSTDNSNRSAQKPPSVPEKPLEPADEAQRYAASLVHLGEHLCEFRQTLQIKANALHEAYVDVQYKNKTYTTRPVLSSTGALRLEDVKGQMLLLQIAFKSMLMDTAAGQRLADDCQHDNHREARRKAEAAPPQPGLGIAAPTVR